MKQLNKHKILLIFILLIGAFLRLYKLPQLMPFIADQGWFYISARDMLMGGGIPLVGITSSHTWLHQGAMWTYILAVILKLFNYNPVAPAVFTALLGVITVFVVYKLGKELFSERVGLISAFLFATAPIIIADARMAYHTSSIPLITALLILSVYRWLGGKILYFPLSLFLIALLYNFEIATFPLSATVFLITLFGLIKKKKWMMQAINRKVISVSVLRLIIPMIPMLIYDLGHGFPQTLKFTVWVFYRIAVFLGYPPLNPNSAGETWTTFGTYTLILIKKLIFLPSLELSMLILTLSFIFLGALVYHNFKRKEINLSHSLILVFFFIPALAYIAAKTNSSAYILIFYPQVIIVIALLFNKFFEKKALYLSSCVLLIAFVFVNAYTTIRGNFLTGPPFTKRVEAARFIIKEANGRPYNILGIGEASIYESFTMPHEYLTWYLGHGPSEKKEKLRFYVSEHIDRIDVERK